MLASGVSVDACATPVDYRGSGVSTTIDQLETPVVLVDRERLIANIERVQAIARQHDLALRPHVKTHKCIEIAKLQLEHGAVGLTASKVDEALVFVESRTAGLITVAYPIVDRRKLDRLASAAARIGVEPSIVVDSKTGVDVARGSSVPLEVFIKIDVGLHRCGIDESASDLIGLAKQIESSSNLRLAGLLAHAGHAYAESGRAGIARVANDERETLLRARNRLLAAGFGVRAISVGSTPTVLAAESFDGITEVRPGNYVFFDGTAMRLGIATAAQVALTVLTTIISSNSRSFIIDAGSKVLSSDLGAHGTGADSGYGVALQIDESGAEPLRIARLSEEHGFVDRGERDLPIGTKLRIIPNHACPVANLAERLIIVSQNEIVGQWSVAARGKVR